MPAVVYNDGTLYGSGALYGRLAASFINAQLAQVRETGLLVSIIDERTNRWEFLTGVGQDPTPYSENLGADRAWTQRYWSYRGQADVCVLDNGNIVRVRNHVDTRDIEVQEITDPTVASQWTTWSSYNTDDNYAVAVAPNGSSYVIYHVKSDGLYRNNVKVWDQEGLMRLRLHRGTDGRQVLDAIWVVKTSEGVVRSDGTQLRKFDLFFSEDVSTDDPVEVAWNWVWQRHTAFSIAGQNSKFYKFTTYPLYAPADSVNTGDSLMVTEHLTIDDMLQFPYPQLIRGVPGDYGHNTIANGDVFYLADGYYYMIYNEVHTDEEFEFTTNLKTPLVWQRSKDLKHWSEPVHMGFNAWGMAGLVEVGDYVYLAGNGEVYRRPNTPVSYAIEDYVPQIGWESPRENQTGTGSLVIANPEGINDYLEELNDRRIIVKPGIKLSDGQFEFAQLDDFWLSSVKKDIDGQANRITAQFGTIWNRLENPMRDTMNFIGRTIYEDFKSGAPNEAFAYFFESGEGEVDDEFRLQASGNVVWTGWKGYNPAFRANFVGASSQSPFSLLFRYVDENNYCKLEYNSTQVKLFEVVDGVATQNGSSHSVSGITHLELHVIFKTVRFRHSGTSSWTTHTLTDPGIVRPGYCGFGRSSDFTVASFIFEDVEYNYLSEDLIRHALALGDYHDVVVGSAEERQFALVWGPQTDLPTAADALRQLLEAGKLELTWRGGFIEVGRFSSTDPIRIIENEVISSQEIGEANRRINLANVDGNSSTWMEVDFLDALLRDRMINAYYDLPELMDEDAVRLRAVEEIRRGKLGQSPGGVLPLQFDLWRMDPITWVDNQGNSKLVRIEGIRVEINQSSQPSQRMTVDTSLI